MAKNKRQFSKATPVSPTPAPNSGDVISQRGKKVIGLGIGTVIIGFWLLTFTDPAGQNWASTAAPAALVLGYALIGLGIVLPDPPNLN